jgi:hypothetical protein
MTSNVKKEDKSNEKERRGFDDEKAKSIHLTLQSLLLTIRYS